jgi:cellulose synthase/poly-beta-1,6-N-acetylglucosamine synthase-like glycosyltransferase
MNVVSKIPPPPMANILHDISPRWSPPPTPLRSVAIHGGVFALWLVLFVRAFWGGGLLAWSVGIIYITYDTLLLGFTFWKTLDLRRPPPFAGQADISLGVIVAAFNEASVLRATIEGLTSQTSPPDEIILADDGSNDGSAAVLAQYFALAQPAIGEISPPSAIEPRLRWLRLPHGGKARALNAALAHVQSELMLTVDADTLLDADALAAMRAAFAADPGLVAATGVLTPVCNGTASGRFFQWFQTYEYIRNFLSRHAWARMDSLLLISGAFAGFRRAAVIAVGGFDDDCLVEDYELIHRLRRHGALHQLGWHSTVLGSARARTSAPATPMAFLRQRRRWFGGFLQTQYWYRDMVGDGRYGWLGTLMLPVKAVDTMQPIYGLCAFGLLIFYIVTGRLGVLFPVAGLIGAKILIDLAFHLWSVHLYRKWVGGRTDANIGLAFLAAIAEPFTFQLFRHTGAAWGWVYFVTGQKAWGKQKRS